ncbi:MAG TPA: metal-sensitive transcriptional regulator [Candidatus Dojkabacteria bacterium]|jgi:DNA-binding FrmR family transcriptional regulator
MEKVRLNKIKGQINGIEKMLDDDRACLEVVQQIAAARAALAQLGIEILKNEAKSCMKDSSKEKSFEKIIDKLFKIS